LGGGVFQDGNLNEAYDSLSELRRALASVQGAAPPGQRTDLVFEALEYLDWSKTAVMDFLEYVSDSGAGATPCATTEVDEAVEALKSALGYLGASWYGAAATNCTNSIQTIISNCQAVSKRIEIMAQDLAAETGEVRVNGAEPKSATELMDEFTGDVKKKTATIAKGISADAQTVLYGDPADPAYTAAVTNLVNALAEVKAAVNEQITNVGDQVVHLTMRDTGAVELKNPGLAFS
jgi:hypothetical protein